MLIGSFTLFWLNLSPFYIEKEKKHNETLKILYDKYGTSMNMLN